MFVLELFEAHNQMEPAAAVSMMGLQVLIFLGYLLEQQQQQHSLFSQASWGRLEMKPKKK